MECGQWVNWLKELANCRIIAVVYNKQSRFENKSGLFYIDIRGGIKASDICSILYPVSGFPIMIIISN